MPDLPFKCACNTQTVLGKWMIPYEGQFYCDELCLAKAQRLHGVHEKVLALVRVQNFQGA